MPGATRTRRGRRLTPTTRAGFVTGTFDGVPGAMDGAGRPVMVESIGNEWH